METHDFRTVLFSNIQLSSDFRHAIITSVFVYSCPLDSYLINTSLDKTHRGRLSELDTIITPKKFAFIQIL